MKNTSFLILFFCSGIAYANDGSFYSSGNTLIPLKETTIQLKKEILSLNRDNTFMQVDVYFEFYNPGAQKELTVGFVTPPASGDVRKDEEQHPQIENFMVMVNGELLEYKVSRMESSGFKINSKLADGNDFVYYFKVMFNKGSTVIRHSYKYRGGSSTETESEFYYRLTTGTSWANNAIDDFELNINMGGDCYFAVPASFDKTPVPWLIAGIGRISDRFERPFNYEDKPDYIKMVYQKEGSLRADMKNFKPERDLSLTIYQLHNEIFLWTNNKENDFGDLPEMIFDRDSAALKIGQFSDGTLRLYKNLEYARSGYNFKDSTLKAKFSKYIWYIPDPALKPENISNHYFGNELQQQILNEERKRKIK